MMMRKAVANNIIQRVDQSYIDKLTAEGLEYSRQTLTASNAILEFTEVNNDHGRRFFQDHFVTVQIDPNSHGILIPDLSYRIVSADSSSIELVDDIHLSASDCYFDLVSPGVVQLSESPVVSKLEYEKLLKDLIKGGPSSTNNKLLHVISRTLGFLRAASSQRVSVPSDLLSDLHQFELTLESRPYIEVSVEANLERSKQ